MTNVSIHMVHGAQALQFYGLSPMSIRASLDARDVPSDIALYGLYASDRPAALLVAFLELGSSTASLRSVAVARDCRRQGFATRLIRHFEQDMLRRGRTSIELMYMSGGAISESIQGLLQKTGWPRLVPTMLNCETDYATLSQAPWAAERKRVRGFDYELWRNVSAEERAEILERQARESFFASDLSPFLLENEMDLSKSLALRHEGKVAGWCIMRHIDEATTQCASLFVEQRYQRTGWAIWLLARCIDLHRDTPSHQWVFDVKLERPAMVSFVDRRMRPYLKRIRYLSRARKAIGPFDSAVIPGPVVERPSPAGAVACA